MSNNRIKIWEADQAAYKAMMDLSKYAESTDISKTHKELIKLRASQINGCAFCLDMHSKEARAHGETEQRIYTLNAWRDTDFFDEKEQAILALTEEITLISNHVSDETYQRAAAVLEPAYLAQVILCIITINGWNRIAISTGMKPPRA